MKGDVFTQDDLRQQNIITTDYVLNLEPGEFLAVLDMKAEARRCLRAFFTFDDGRRIKNTALPLENLLIFVYNVDCIFV